MHSKAAIIQRQQAAIVQRERAVIVQREQAAITQREQAAAIKRERARPDARFNPALFIAALSCIAVLCWWLTAQQRPRGSEAGLVSTNVNESEPDAGLQRAAVSALNDREGTIIVMDAQTGRVRTVVNSRVAFEQAFAPGSTIKVFTALAAMQSGLINESSRLLCQQRYAKDDFEIACSHPEVNAPFDPAQALAYSCNYYYGKLGERLGEHSFDATLHSFGFGARTGIVDEEEATGSLPRADWRASNALGEGRELLVTPIQLLTAYAALVNGGHLYTPQITGAREFNKRERARLSIAPEHLALLMKGMSGAITYGTAERAALNRLPLYLFGKTGTATMSDSLQTQGWFVGFASGQKMREAVRPENVELAVLVFLKGTHGAQCAEAARFVFEEFARQRSTVSPVTAHAVDNTETGAALPAVAAEPDATPARFSSVQESPPPASVEVRVYLAGEQRVVSVSFEDYVLGVVAAEGAIETELEALKALAVAVRTYASQNLDRHAREGYDFCNTTHCQRYTFAGSSEQAAARSFVRRALVETAGEVLLDERGRRVDAYFHAACGGMTANVATLWGGSLAPAHLRGVRDEYCALMPHHAWADVIPAARLSEALRSDARTNMGARLENVFISRRDTTGRAELMTLEGARRRVVRGWDFKIIVGRALGWHLLKSSRFEVVRAGANFIFRGGGFGHGVGLCQEGAHVMARRRLHYRQILNYYFPGTSTGSIASERDRQVPENRRARAAGTPAYKVEALAYRAEVSAYKADVLTREVEPGGSRETTLFLDSKAAGFVHDSFSRRLVGFIPQHRRLSLAGEHFRLSYPSNVERREALNVLRALEAARADLLSRVGKAFVSPDEGLASDVIIHETTGDFVAATGQPRWAAGATRGRRIELQPMAVLLRRGILLTTLRHEYAHILIDALSRGRAPRWLAEGLAIHVAGEGAMAARFATRAAPSIEQLEQSLTRPASAEEMRASYSAAYRRVRALIRTEGEQSVWRRLAQNQ